MQSVGSGSENTVVEAGKTFEVPVRISQGTEIGAYRLTVDLDDEKASFEGVEATYDGALVIEENGGTVQVGVRPRW